MHCARGGHISFGVWHGSGGGLTDPYEGDNEQGVASMGEGEAKVSLLMRPLKFYTPYV